MREQGAGAAEIDRDFVADQQYTGVFGRVGDGLQRGRIVHLHAARALRQRFHDHGGDLAPVVV